jgi:hypothetical protein
MDQKKKVVLGLNVDSNLDSNPHYQNLKYTIRSYCRNTTNGLGKPD